MVERDRGFRRTGTQETKKERKEREKKDQEMDALVEEEPSVSRLPDILSVRPSMVRLCKVQC